MDRGQDKQRSAVIDGEEGVEDAGAPIGRGSRIEEGDVEAAGSSNSAKLESNPEQPCTPYRECPART